MNRMRLPRTPRLSVLFGLLAVFGALYSAAAQEGTISASEVARYLGENRTVCGFVASATFASQSRGQPTLLNLDKPYPGHIFTIVIWGSDRPRFTVAPERALRDKRVCVTGLITEYRGKPQIVVTLPSQIQVTPAR